MHDLPLFLPSTRLRLLLVVCALAVVSLLYLPLPLLPSLTEQYGQQATRLVSFYGFSYAIGFLVFGPLSDYVGRQRIMMIGLALLSFVTLAMAFSPTFTVLLVSRGIQGFIAASFPPVVIAYLAERGSVSDRKWGVALLSTAALLAGIVGQVYGMSVASQFGLTLSVIPLCLLYLLTAFALSKVPNENPSQLKHGMSLFMVRIIAFPAFFMPLFMIWFASTWSAQKSLTAGLGLTTLGLIIAAWANSTYLWLLLFSSFVFVAGIGMSIPSLITRITLVTAAERRGLAIALYTFFLFIGAGFGPIIAQLVSELSLGKSYAILAILMGIGSIYATGGFLIKRKE